VSPSRRALLLARIASGIWRSPSRYRSLRVEVRPPSALVRYEAEEAYQQAYRQAELEGCYNDHELLAFLLEHSLWDATRQDMLAVFPKDIEEFKLKLYELAFKSREREAVRAALAKAKARLEELYAQRHSHDHLSCAGVAAAARQRHLVSRCLYTSAGTLLFPEGVEEGDTSCVLEDVLTGLATERLAEAELRELAREEPWRSCWVCKSAEASIFGVAFTDYTEEQRALVGWSGLYDSVYEHPDCPADAVIADDDLLDGWLIAQRRARDKKRLQKEAEGLLGSDKLKGAQEVFIVAQTAEDARKIDAFNDAEAAAIKKARMNLLAKQGTVNEVDMPDTKRRLQTEMAAKFAQSMRERR
jgi:hypothetical protein